MSKDLDVTVIIATHNRADILKETLEQMELLDRSGINTEFIVVDNNSTDNTKQVIESFYGRLPIRYLFEAKPGQNCARNRALAEAVLGKIVAFTDDDIVPKRDWLQTIVSVARRWAEYSVFGGKIYVIWPVNEIPKWAESSHIKSLAFAEHDYAESECEYISSLNEHPFSGNFWVRREVFDGGRRFDDSIAWHPGNRILATETAFFQELSNEGFKFFYCPDAVVGHRVMPQQMTLLYLIKRAHSSGRGIAHMQPLCRGSLFNKHPIFWRFIRVGAVVRLGFSGAISLVPLVMQKPKQMIYAVRWIGYNVESLSIAEGYKRK